MPENSALRVCEPTVVKVASQVAVPWLSSATVSQPVSGRPASPKATVPPSGIGLTAAVRVVGAPTATGLVDEVSAVVTAIAGRTAWLSGVAAEDW